MSIEPESAPGLPPGRQLAVTWGIPEGYGGMTAALLHRSRAFVREARTPVDIVTFDPRPLDPGRAGSMRERGELIEGIRLWNVWEDFGVTLDVSESSLDVLPIVECGRPPDEMWRGDARTVRVWHSAGSPARLQHHSLDGRVRLIDERGRAGGPRRLITAIGRGRMPVRQWTSAWAFYSDALDALLGDEATFAIVDSKTAARFFQTYRRPQVTNIHLVHGSHLERASEQCLSSARRPVLENARKWDAIVFLTERQRRDVARLLGDSGNFAVLPNGLSPSAEPSSGPRDPHRGVIVASLTGRKRVEHALQIVAAARAAGTAVRLDVIGEGRQRALLESQARRLGIAGAVRFTGHIPRAAERYRDASWTLLTSSSEGAPLVLSEAMAAGCIPIAYDIRYGPADVIDDARSGFLVPDGDIAAAAAALVRLCAMDEDERRALRVRARGAGAAHSDAQLVARWSELQRRARRSDGRRRTTGLRSIRAGLQLLRAALPE